MIVDPADRLRPGGRLGNAIKLTDTGTPGSKRERGCRPLATRADGGSLANNPRQQKLAGVLAFSNAAIFLIGRVS